MYVDRYLISYAGLTAADIQTLQSTIKNTGIHAKVPAFETPEP